MTIQFCGAARQVTGSSHLITLDNGTKILLDCGLNQGDDEFSGKKSEQKNNNDQWYFTPSEIDCMVLSHAHVDHCGRLPKLVQDGFVGKIFCTHATKNLGAIMLLDSAAIQESDFQYRTRKYPKQTQRPPLFTAASVKKTMSQITSINYEEWTTIADGVEILLRDMGHILGSASVTLRISENGKKTVLGFTADIGRPNRPILRDPLPMPEVDFLICESTYGDKLHQNAPDELDGFLQVIIDTCITKKGKLIIPAFSMGRTQELVYMLDRLFEAGRLPAIPIYVDSPMAVEATQIFELHPECYDYEIHAYMLEYPDPFGFRGLTYIRDVEQSKSLNTRPEPCIIISASGMASSGRIVHHLFNNVSDEKNTVLIVGYCGHGTLGNALQSQPETVEIMHKIVPLKANVVSLHSFSAHGDQAEMLAVIRNQIPTLKKLFLVHGEYETQQVFSAYLQKNGFTCLIEIPDMGDVVAL